MFDLTMLSIIFLWFSIVFCGPACIGEFPTSGDGRVRVRLSPASADILEKVPNLQRWQVATTMTRGSKASDKTLNADVAPGNGPVAPGKGLKKTEKSTKKEKSIVQVAKRHLKKKTIKPAKPTVPVEEHGPDSIRRNNNGRVVVQELLTEILDLDEKSFEAHPAFRPSGELLMQLEGANTIKRQDIIHHAPKAFETMYLG